MSSTARSVGVPPTAADGWSEAARVSDDASSALTAATSVARCMTLGRCSTKGASGTFIDERVRLEGVGDRAHGVLVLLEVLRRAGQRGGEAEVLGVVAGAADRAGEHPRGDEALVAADEQLRGGAEQARRPRRPRCSRSARRAVAAATGRRWARWRSRRGRGRARPCRPRRRRCARPPRRRSGRSRPATPRRRRRRCRAAAPDRLRDGRNLEDRQLRVERHGGQPGAPVAATDDGRGHDEPRALGGVVGEGEGAEADEPGAGALDLVAHDGVGHDLAPPRLGVAEAARPARLEGAGPGPSRRGRRRGAPTRRGRPGRCPAGQ